MGDKTKIEWTDATWNPVIGCSKVSAGCQNCYAESVAARFAIQHKDGEFKGYYYDVLHFTDYEKWVWSGETVRKDPEFNPLRARKSRTIFVCSMGDLFHKSVPDEWIDEVMQVIHGASWHRFMILTKRPDRMRAYMNAFPWGNPPSNLALGVSIEDQKTADERIPILLQTPAEKRFVSYEPALRPVDLRFLRYGNIACVKCDGSGSVAPYDGSSGGAMCPICEGHGSTGGIDLVIMGGESGPKARPTHPDWARSMRDQCEIAGVPFHFKQWGKWVYPSQMTEETFRAWDYWHGTENHHPKPWGFTKQQAGRLLDGVEHNGVIDWGISR